MNRLPNVNIDTVLMALPATVREVETPPSDVPHHLQVIVDPELRQPEIATAAKTKGHLIAAYHFRRNEDDGFETLHLLFRTAAACRRFEAAIEAARGAARSGL
jgi:hypothetical protein